MENDMENKKVMSPLNESIVENLMQIRVRVKEMQPLIHCITNPISINDCANIVLATGARPIMAEHPGEVEEITTISKVLAVNLGNITDARIESIMKSGKLARTKQIPCIIDMVGVACSHMRREFAYTFIEKCKPAIIKGNITEIKAVFGSGSCDSGIDVSKADKEAEQQESGLREQVKIVTVCAAKAGAVVLASGATDIISDGTETYLIKNGTPMLADITGTGCMLNVLTASYLSYATPIQAAVLATSVMGICGELSYTQKGTGSFRTNLLDNIYTLTDSTFMEKLSAFINISE